MLEVKKRYPNNSKMRKYTGAYEVPEQLKPIVDDLLELLTRILKTVETSVITAIINLNTFDDWSKFNVEFVVGLNQDTSGPTAEQEFVNNIIDSTILEISRLDRSAMFTFSIYNGAGETTRNYKLLLDEEEDNPFKE